MSRPAEAPARRRSAYMNPYLAGFGLGIVLLATWVVMGRGLGASGAFGSFVSWVVSLVAPQHAEASDYFSNYLAAGFGHPLEAWLVFEVLGVAVGGFVSAWLAGRLRPRIERGPRASDGMRLALAVAGGVLTAYGARLARGCTSGQALSGGAVLNAGSWAFMFAVFAGGYALAALLRRAWR